MYQSLFADGACFIQGFPLHHFGNQRAARQGRDTALGSKPNFADSACLEPDGQFQDVTTDWVFDTHARIGIGEVAGVARVFKVIEKLRRKHALRSLQQSSVFLLPRKTLPPFV